MELNLTPADVNFLWEILDINIDGLEQRIDELEKFVATNGSKEGLLGAAVRDADQAVINAAVQNKKLFLDLRKKLPFDDTVGQDTK